MIGPPIPQPPPIPRTVDAVLRYADRLFHIATSLRANLQVCDDRRQALLDGIDDHTAP